MTIADQQTQMIRQSLINSISQKYTELYHMIATLPVSIDTVQIQKGLSYLDDGMIWIEKAINILPLELNNDLPELDDNQDVAS